VVHRRSLSFLRTYSAVASSDEDIHLPVYLLTCTVAGQSRISPLVVGKVVEVRYVPVASLLSVFPFCLAFSCLGYGDMEQWNGKKRGAPYQESTSPLSEFSGGEDANRSSAGGWSPANEKRAWRWPMGSYGSSCSRKLDAIHPMAVLCLPRRPSLLIPEPVPIAQELSNGFAVPGSSDAGLQLAC